MIEQACRPVDYDGVVDTLIKQNPDKFNQAFENPSLLNWFLGQCMMITRGTGNPNYFLKKIKERINLKN